MHQIPHDGYGEDDVSGPSIQFHESPEARMRHWKNAPRQNITTSDHRMQHENFAQDMRFASTWSGFEDSMHHDETEKPNYLLRRSLTEYNPLDHHSLRHQAPVTPFGHNPSSSNYEKSLKSILAYPSNHTTSYEVNVPQSYAARVVIEQSPEHTPAYPKMTTMASSEQNPSMPLVEATFVDPTKCPICDKKISRDMIRHMWTHKSEKRFTCVFPKGSCQHKSGLFNRRYDFKKHLLNRHFAYDDMAAKREHNLLRKLSQWGTCPCGQRFISGDWLEDHILTKVESKKCTVLHDIGRDGEPKAHRH